MLRVEIHGKPGCTLCDEAKELLLRLQKDLPFELAEVDVTLDPALERSHGAEVPVVFVDGRKAFKLRFTEKEARRRIERALENAGAQAEGEAAPAPRASRGLRVAFLAAALLALGGVVAARAHDVFVTQPALAEEAFDITPARPVVAPDFRLETPDGKPFSMAAVRGKVVFVNFWATWCPPCREEMPSLLRLGRELEQEYPGEFQMVAVSVDEGWEPIRQFFTGMPPPGILVGLDREQLATRAYYCSARGGCPDSYKFPESYIVDKRGRLVAYVVGPRDWSEPAARRFLRRLIRS